LLILAIGFVAVVGLTVRPVDYDLDNAETKVGTVQTFFHDTLTNDFVIQLNEGDELYYVNRAFEKYPNVLFNQGDSLTITYVNHWSPLNLNGRMKPTLVIKQAGKEVISILPEL